MRGRARTVKLLTYEDIAQMTAVRVPTLYVWRQRGKLPAPDIDNFQPLWKPETIKKWMHDEGLSGKDQP